LLGLIDVIIQIVIVRYIDHGQHFFVAKFQNLAINNKGCDSYKGFFGEKIAQSHHNSKKKSQI
jgi:hypothetical protein